MSDDPPRDWLDDHAEKVLSTEEFARWRLVRDDPIVSSPFDGIIGGAKQRIGEAGTLYETIVRKTVAALREGAELLGVPANDPIADPRTISADALARAVDERVLNLDLEKQRLWRGGTLIMIDLEFREAPPPKGPVQAAPESTIAAETHCTAWFVDLMANGSRPEKTNAGYLEEAYGLFPGLSKRACGRARKAAIAQTGNYAWKKSGPKTNSLH